MHLQRIILPSGHVTWTAYDGDAIVTEIHEFVIYLEARHQCTAGEFLALWSRLTSYGAS